MLSPYLVSRYQHHGHVIMDAYPIVTGICREASSVDYQDPFIRILERSGEILSRFPCICALGKTQDTAGASKMGVEVSGLVDRATGQLLLLVQPGRRADIGTPAQCLIQTGHLQRRGMADEYLAREIDTQAAML
jgi:hypothetical protein